MSNEGSKENGDIRRDARDATYVVFKFDLNSVDFYEKDQAYIVQKSLYMLLQNPLKNVFLIKKGCMCSLPFYIFSWMRLFRSSSQIFFFSSAKTKKR